MAAALPGLGGGPEIADACASGSYPCAGASIATSVHTQCVRYLIYDALAAGSQHQPEGSLIEDMSKVLQSQ